MSAKSKPLLRTVAACAGKVPPELEDRFYTLLRLPNGTWKTTYRRRLDDLNDWLLDFLPRGRPLEVMDVAVSSGISTVEWSEQLSANGIQHRLVAGDLAIDGWLVSWGKRGAVLFDHARQEPLLLELGPKTVSLLSDRVPIR